ncbi:hypothetical protein [Mucilaginibacter pedocola]|uniref:Uncharacterized protein n=1 Tax=Mucilaginibacter pedocola TaxID=1792845 RepID=A0A1S9PE34_9SPHI|nr:hypothetical protein [Mucilaginibacter pedocola]OOQ59169.1 hypothetical protein BC343_28830 [Mucilaginibacter pedocola]
MMQANWAYIVIGLCLLLAVFMLWQEFARANKKRLALRATAVVLAAAMFACIALPISYQKDAVGNAEEYILLTDGFHADSLKAAPNQHVFTIDAKVKKAYPSATLLSGVSQLTDTLEGASLQVYGYGLSPAALAQMDSLALVFHPSPIPAGVSNVGWKQEIKAGEALQVQGRYNNSSAQKVKLLLNGLNTVLDTVVIKPNGQYDFQLATKPKTLGRVVYTLQSVMDGDTVNLGSIPAQVEPVKPLRVLMLASAPNFESKFLKNWLAQNGYAVAGRSAISKDKNSSEFINMPQISLDRLSASILGKFDVVMGDLSTLNTLNNTDAGALKQEVENKGLGIIVRADSAGKSSWLQKSFPVQVSAAKEVPASLSINGQKTASAKLNIGNTYIVYQNGTQPIAIAPQSRIVASAALSGAGKLVFTTLDNTYTWALDGNTRDYATLWSALISAAARRDTTSKQVLMTGSLAIAKEPVRLTFAQSRPAPVQINGEYVAAEQNQAIPFEWSATYRPTQNGWQSFAQNGKTEWWYAYNKQEWGGVQAAEKLAATRQYAAKNKPGNIVTKQIQQKLRIEVPKIYFYMLLLAACTFLWVERKLS